VLRGALGSGAIKGANFALTSATSILLARTLGPSGYGQYAFAISVALFLAIPSQMGVSTLVLRETGALASKKDWAPVAALVSSSTRLVLKICLLLAGPAAFLVIVVWGGAPTTERSTLLWALAIVPLVALITVLAAVARGLQHLLAGQLPEFVLRPALVLGSLALFSVLVATPSAATAMALNALGTVGALLLTAYGLRVILKRRGSFAGRLWRKGDPLRLRTVGPLAILSSVQVIFSQTDIFALRWLGTVEEVGQYRVAVQGAAVVAFALNALNLYASPMMPKLLAGRQQLELQRLVTKVSWMALVAALLVAMPFLLLAESIIGVVVGADFIGGALAMQVLVGAQLVNSAAGPVDHLLTMSGHERVAIKLFATAFLINVAMSVILIPQLGMLGAAIGTSLGIVYWNGAAQYRAKQATGIASGTVRAWWT
jgi:O-antigen/teichoic acid export membrane protein